MVAEQSPETDLICLFLSIYRSCRCRRHTAWAALLFMQVEHSHAIIKPSLKNEQDLPAEMGPVCMMSSCLAALFCGNVRLEKLVQSEHSKKKFPASAQSSLPLFLGTVFWGTLQKKKEREWSPFAEKHPFFSLRFQRYFIPFCITFFSLVGTKNNMLYYYYYYCYCYLGL